MAEKTGVENTQDNVITELDEFLKFKPKEDKTQNNIVEEDAKPNNKRKRNQNEEDMSIDNILSIFLKIIYPLTGCLKKFVVVGLNKMSECQPCVLIHQCGKSIVLNEKAWNSLEKRMQLINCYLINNISGKKTSLCLLESNIEVEIIMFRGTLYVRLRDLTAHDLKIQLTREEFSILYASSTPITYYINQLHIVEACCKDYIEDTIDKVPNSQILYSPLDSSIMNRLPQEVELYRKAISHRATLEEKYADNIKEEKTPEDEEEEDDDIEINSQQTLM